MTTPFTDPGAFLEFALVASIATVGPFVTTFVVMCTAALVAMGVAHILARVIWLLSAAFCAVLAFIGNKPSET